MEELAKEWSKAGWVRRATEQEKVSTFYLCFYTIWIFVLP